MLLLFRKCVSRGTSMFCKSAGSWCFTMFQQGRGFTMFQQGMLRCTFPIIDSNEVPALCCGVLWKPLTRVWQPLENTPKLTPKKSPFLHFRALRARNFLIFMCIFHGKHRYLWCSVRKWIVPWRRQKNGQVSSSEWPKRKKRHVFFSFPMIWNWNCSYAIDLPGVEWRILQ